MIVRKTALCLMGWLAALVSGAATTDILYRRAADIRSLPRQVAAKERPVCLEGQVIGDFSANYGPGFVLLDQTGGVYIRAEPTEPLKIGERIRVEGVTFPGLYATVVLARSVTVLGRASLPRGLPAEPETLVSGRCDYQFVSLRGVIISAFPDKADKNWTWLLLKTPAVTVSISLFGERVPRERLASFIDAEVSLEGVVMPIYNSREEFLGARVNLPSLASIRVLNPAPADPFSVPAIPNGTLYNLASTPPMLHRRRLEGIVTATRGEKVFFLFAEGRAIQITLEEGSELPAVGDRVEAAGFIDSTTFFVGLHHALVREVSAGNPLPAAIDIIPRQVLHDAQGVKMFHPDYHGKTVRVKGTLRSVTRLGAANNRRLHLDCEGYLLPVDIGRIAFEELRLGNVLAVTGVCVMEFTESRPFKDFPQVKGFSLIIRSSADVRVLRQASWWTAERLLAVIGGLVLLLAGILIWNLALRHLAERRSRELFRENIARIEAELRVDERTRLAAELHDSFAQSLVGITMQVEAAQLAREKAPAELGPDLEITHQMLLACRDELRRCVWNLRSQALEEHDLSEAIRKTLEPFRASTALAVDVGEARYALSDRTRHTVLRVTQELALNAIRHGRAANVRIRVAFEPEELVIDVADDGSGFDPAKAPGVKEGHFGLQGVRERVARMDGTVAVSSAPGHGARVTVRIPGKRKEA